MVENLSKRIAQREKHRKTSQRTQNKVAFLAMLTDIEQALADGWSIKSIWQTLCAENKTIISYQAFVVYVNRFILRPSSTIANSPVYNKKVIEPKQSSSQIPGFTFRPNLDKEDLI